MACLRSRNRKIYIGVAFALCLLGFFIFCQLSQTQGHDFLKTIKFHVKAGHLRLNNEKANNVSSPILQSVVQAEEDVTLTKRNLLKVLSQDNKCPSCFGNEVCEEIAAEYITLSSVEPIAIHSDLMAFAGLLGNLQKVTIMVPRPDVLGNFDQLVCPDKRLMKWTSKCHSPINAENPFLLSPKEFISHDSIKSFREKLSLPPFSPAILSCPSLKHKELFIKAFDTNENKKLSIEERNLFHSSLTLAPELVTLKMIPNLSLGRSFPRLVGSCGRLFVLKGLFTPLSLMLQKPFSQRAALAVKLLSRVKEFLVDNDSWVLLQPYWAIDNLQINEEGNIYLRSVSAMSFIEKKSHDTSHRETCGWDCVHKLTRKLTSANGYCITAEEAMHIMYSHICAMVLSNMKQHKFKDYFTQEAAERLEFRQFPGLLHGIPSDDKAEIEKLLASCVDESEADERQNAVDELQDVLSDIVDEENEEEQDEEEEEDDDQEYEEDNKLLQKSET